MNDNHDHREPGDEHDDDEEHTSRFMRAADRVSYAMGTWQNIVVWIILVGTWFALGPYLAHHSVLPAWFTSNNFNYPLNTVTTIAELYIGFLVGASTNRTERNNRNQADRMEALEKLIDKELKRTRGHRQRARDRGGGQGTGPAVGAHACRRRAPRRGNVAGPGRRDLMSPFGPSRSWAFNGAAAEIASTSAR